MGNVFTQGQLLNSEDLHITITDDNGIPTDPHELTYTFYRVNKENKITYKVGQSFRVPVRGGAGFYYANERVSSAFLVGDYIVQWAAKRREDSPLEVLGVTEFTVIRV